MTVLSHCTVTEVAATAAEECQLAVHPAAMSCLHQQNPAGAEQQSGFHQVGCRGIQRKNNNVPSGLSALKRNCGKRLFFLYLVFLQLTHHIQRLVHSGSICLKCLKREVWVEANGSTYEGTAALTEPQQH